MIQTNLTDKTERDSQTQKRNSRCPLGATQGLVKDFRRVKYILLSLRWITNKDLLYSTWNSAQAYVPAWMGGGLAENGYMYMYG